MVALMAVLVGCGAARPTADLVEVPHLRGHALEVAFTELRARGLAVSIPSVPDGYNQRDTFAVGSEVPNAGTLVPRGSTVTLHAWNFVALGMLEMPGRRLPGGVAVVPNVVGLPVYRAMRRLALAGVYSQLARVPPIEHSTNQRLFDSYVVKQQSPRAGTRVRWGGILSMTPTGGSVNVTHSQATLIPARR